MKEEQEETGPYISLKFGGIKGGDFNGSPEAMELFTTLDHTDKENLIEVLKAYNGKFFLWWDQVYCTKEEAINYIKNYVTTL